MRLLLLYLLFTNSCHTSSDELFRITISKLFEKQILEVTESVLYVNSQNSTFEIPKKILVGTMNIIIKKTDRSDQIPFLNLNDDHLNNTSTITFAVIEKGGFKCRGEIICKLKEAKYIFHDIKYVTEIE